MRTRQPRTSERATPNLPMRNWPTSEARNADITTAPDAAMLSTPRYLDRKAGATAVNSPRTENPANTATAAGVNAVRTWAGTTIPCTRSGGRGTFRGTVSGAAASTTADTASRARCTTYVRRSG